MLLFKYFGTCLFFCPKEHPFWEDDIVMLNSQGITFKPPDIRDIVFGFLDTITCGSDWILFNYILESKCFIYHTKLNKTSLLLFEEIQNMFQIQCL